MAISAPAPAGSGPLDGIRVLDLTTNFVAYAGRLMADLGAEVIRIEPPSGDPLRRVPPLVDDADGGQASLAHAFLNASKKSISLDLSCTEGRRLFLDLVGRADVVVENFPPGALAGWGVGYAEMQARNRGVVLVSVTPFGQSGPRSGFQATDVTLLAAGGLLSLGGYVDAGPVAVSGEQGYYASAIFAAVGALSALLERDSSGQGKWIDVAGQECVAFALEDAIPEWYLNRNVRRRNGERAREAGTGVYPCKDGYISMVAGRLGTAKAFVALAEWVAAETPGGDELLDEKWRNFEYRRSEEGIARFEAIFEKFCASMSKQELYLEGQARKIAIAPVNTIADVLESPQLDARRFFAAQFDPAVGRELTFPGPPYRLQRSPAALRAAAPRRGESNDAIYRGELGLTERDLEALTAAGVV